MPASAHLLPVRGRGARSIWVMGRRMDDAGPVAALPAVGNLRPRLRAGCPVGAGTLVSSLALRAVAERKPAPRPANTHRTLGTLRLSVGHDLLRRDADIFPIRIHRSAHVLTGQPETAPNRGGTRGRPNMRSRFVCFALVPRTRSSHDFSASTVANFGFKSGTRIIQLLVSFRFRSSLRGRCENLRTSESGH